MIHKTTTIMGAETHYWIVNDSGLKTIVLVHGFRGNHKALTDFAAALGEEWRVILVDLPGHGRSSQLVTTSTIPHFAQFLDHFVQHLNLSSFDLWGHSFGGSIALVYASKHPDNLKTLTLVSPAVSSNGGTLATLGKLYYGFAVHLPRNLQKTWLTSPIIDRISGWFIIKGVSRLRRQQLLIAGRNNLREAIPSVIIESSLSYLKVDFLKAARRVDVPTLVVAGKLDQLVSVERIEVLANNLSYASFKILLKHGHLGPLEAPGTVASITKQFISHFEPHKLPTKYPHL